MSRPTICLNMIVKDEAHVIARCLTSARPLIDRWCIVDTGSSDDTIATIRSVLADVPAKYISARGAISRTIATKRWTWHARRGSDYVLFVDADETFVVPPDFAWPALDADAYEFSIQYDQIRYARVALVASRVPWRWHGALHEYLDCGQPHSAGALTAPTILVRHDGARSRRDHLPQATSPFSKRNFGRSRTVHGTCSIWRRVTVMPAVFRNRSEPINAAPRWAAGTRRSGTRCFRSPYSANA